MTQPALLLACRPWYHPLVALCLLDNLGHRIGLHRLAPVAADHICDWHDRALMRWYP